MKKNYLYLNSRDELLRLDISKIVYFEADGNYTNIFLANNLKCVVCLNLMSRMRAVNPHFVQKERGCLASAFPWVYLCPEKLNQSQNHEKKMVGDSPRIIKETTKSLKKSARSSPNAYHPFGNRDVWEIRK